MKINELDRKNSAKSRTIYKIDSSGKRVPMRDRDGSVIVFGSQERAKQYCDELNKKSGVKYEVGTVASTKVNEAVDPQLVNDLKSHWDSTNKPSNVRPNQSVRDRHGAFSPQRFAEILNIDPQRGPRFSPDKQTVDEIIAYCNNRNHSTLNALLHTMAWGGMNRSGMGKNAKLLRDSLRDNNKAKQVVPVLRKIRFDKSISRAKAFDMIQNLRGRGLIPGLGIAFFTKILFFFMSNRGAGKDAYILDQFLAQAINLLNKYDPQNYPRVAVTDEGMADGSISGADYERYCKSIEHLASDLSTAFKETIVPRDAEFIVFQPLRQLARQHHDATIGNQPKTTRHNHHQPTTPRPQASASGTSPEGEKWRHMLMRSKNITGALWQTWNKVPVQDRQDCLDDEDFKNLLRSDADEQQILSFIKTHYSSNNLSENSVKYIVRFTKSISPYASKSTVVKHAGRIKMFPTHEAANEWASKMNRVYREQSKTGSFEASTMPGNI
jgi:hypothetical protein